MKVEEDATILQQAPPTSVTILQLLASSPNTSDSHSLSIPPDSDDSLGDYKQSEQSSVWGGSHESHFEAKTVLGENDCNLGKPDAAFTTATFFKSRTDLPSQEDQMLAPNVDWREEEPQACLTKTEDEPSLLRDEFCDDSGSTYLSPTLGNGNSELETTTVNNQERPTGAQDDPYKHPPQHRSHRQGDTHELRDHGSSEHQDALNYINRSSLGKEDPADFHQKPGPEWSPKAMSGWHAQEIGNSDHQSLPKHVTAAQRLGSDEIVGLPDQRYVVMQICVSDTGTEESLLRRTPPLQKTDEHRMQGRDTSSITASAGKKDDGEEEEGLAKSGTVGVFVPKRRQTSSPPFSHRSRLKFFLLKYILFLLNFCFWTASVAAMGVGGWVLRERGRLARGGASFFLDPSGVLCLLGALMFLTALSGCLGALRENILLLQMFQVSTVAVLILEALIVLLVFAFYQIPEFREQLKGGPEEVLRVAIRRYHDDGELRRWTDLIQREFQCCGARHSPTGYKDWQQNPYFNCTPHNPSAQWCGVPRSCCIIERGEYINYMCGFDTTNKQRGELFGRIYTQGCMKGLGLWLWAHEVTIGAVSLSIIVPQIVCVVLAHLLVQHVQRQRVRWRELLHSDT